MAYLVLGEPTLADAPGGDRRGNREAEHIEEAGHERRHGESDIGEGGGGLVEGEGIDARNLSVLRHRPKATRVSPASSVLATSTAFSRVDVVSASRTLS